MKANTSWLNKLRKAKGLTKFNIFILVVSSVVAAVLILTNTGRIPNSPFGAGDYYYTDIKNYDKLFFGEGSIYLGTDHPILFFSIFIGWGLICWSFLKWLEEKK